MATRRELLLEQKLIEQSEQIRQLKQAMMRLEQKLMLTVKLAERAQGQARRNREDVIRITRLLTERKRFTGRE